MQVQEIRLTVSRDERFPTSLLTQLEIRNSGNQNTIVVDQIIPMDDYKASFITMMEYITEQVINLAMEEKECQRKHTGGLAEKESRV